VHTSDQPRVVIVGGGISGLAAAFHLQELAAEQRLSLDLRLFEATTRLGGIIRTESVNGYLLEGGPDSMAAQKPAGRRFCEKLGLGDDLVHLDTTEPSIQLVHRGKLYGLPRGFLLIAPTRVGALLASPLFSWRGKARILCEPLVPSRPSPHGDESLRDFVTRRLGREAFERVAEPIVAGLFTADADEISLDMTMPRFLELERTHGSVIRGLQRAVGQRGRSGGGGFDWPRSGMGSIVERLAARLSGCHIETGVRVDGLTFLPSEARWGVQPAGLSGLKADAVILAGPGFSSSRLVRDVDDELARELAGLRYASCATINLVYRTSQIRKPLEGHGFFVPRTENVPLLACSYVSVKFGGRVPRDRILLRAFVGGALDPGVVDRDEEELSGQAHRVLAGLLGIDGPPVFSQARLFPHAMPQFPVGHRLRLDSLLQRLENHPGLFVAGTAIGAVGIPDCVSSGERAARRVVEFLAADSREILKVVGGPGS